MEPAKKFGREVRRRRVALGLTLEELAERAELSPNYVGTVENGRRNPSLTTMTALAAGLGVPVRDLLGAPATVSATGREIGRSFDAAPREFQELILHVVKLAQGRRSTK